MSTSTNEPLSDIVQRFVAAEDALTTLRERGGELQRAAEHLQQVTSAVDTSTRTSVEALEQTRADLRRRLETEQELAGNRGQLDTAIGEVMAEVHQVLVALQSIDPVRFAAELGELRRDGADNATEVREVRRLTDEVQRDQAALRQSNGVIGETLATVDASIGAVGMSVTGVGEAVEGLVPRVEEIGSAVEGIGADVGGIRLRQDEIAMDVGQQLVADRDALAKMAMRLNIALALAATSAIAAVVGLFL